MFVFEAAVCINSYELLHWSVDQVWGRFHQLFYARLFCAQLIETCEWQPAQLNATCEWHTQHNFCMKKHGETCFQKQTASLSFTRKSLT
jgi:hypothetical protein